jgi:hypothetical protein
MDTKYFPLPRRVKKKKPEDMMKDIEVRKPYLSYDNLSEVSPKFLDQSTPSVTSANPSQFRNPTPVSTLNLRDQQAQRIQANYRLLLGQTEVAEERGAMALSGEVGRMSKFLASHSTRFSPEIRERLSGRTGEFKTSHVERHLRGKSTREKKELLGGVIADADMREAYEEFAEQDRKARSSLGSAAARTTRVSPPRQEVNFNDPLQGLHDDINRIMDAVEEGRDGFEY